MKRVVFALVAVATLGFTATAQQTSPPEANPVSSALRQLVDRESTNTVAAVAEMPAEKFNFQPTPQQQTFAHLAAHMVDMNYLFCSNISGTTNPKAARTSDADSKDALVAALKSSFDFCKQSLANLDDSKLGEQLPFFGGRKASRGMVIVVMAQDYGDHYAQASIYLRLNGLLPPTAQPRK